MLKKILKIAAVLLILCSLAYSINLMLNYKLALNIHQRTHKKRRQGYTVKDVKLSLNGELPKSPD